MPEDSSEKRYPKNLPPRVWEEILSEDSEQETLEECIGPLMGIVAKEIMKKRIKKVQNMLDAPKLTIELVPENSWYKNLRSLLSRKDWDTLRREVYRRVDYRCEICGGKGPRHPVECHEKWEYDEDAHIQKLVGMFGLCPLCHQAKHIGLAKLRGQYSAVKEHIKKVNGWSEEEFEQYELKIWSTWHRRNNITWEIDTIWLERRKDSENQNEFSL